MPGNHGRRGLASVLPELQRLKSRGTGFLLEKWEECRLSLSFHHRCWVRSGDGLGICTCIKPPGDPTVD